MIKKKTQRVLTAMLLCATMSASATTQDTLIKATIAQGATAVIGALAFTVAPVFGIYVIVIGVMITQGINDDDGKSKEAKVE